ncbi:MAG: hypothetical protein U0744_07040 [Gemmataceae bacterium]
MTTFTIAPLATPAPLAPTGTVATDTPTFAWTAVANAARYDLWVDNATTGTSQVIRQSQLVGTTWTSTALSPGNTYNWWIRALSSNGTAGPWCLMQTFAVAALATPVLVGPSGTIASTTPTFQWNAAPLAHHYELWVNDLTSGGTPLWNGNIAATTYTPASQLLTAGHQYRWWVRAISANGTVSNWSNPLDFTIST